jgi:hypothetical protein
MLRRKISYLSNRATWQSYLRDGESHRALGRGELRVMRVRGLRLGGVRPGHVGGVPGFNWQMGAAVFGVEADGNWANLDGTNTCFAFSGFFIQLPFPRRCTGHIDGAPRRDRRVPPLISLFCRG